MILFLRRPKLGRASCMGMSTILTDSLDCPSKQVLYRNVCREEQPSMMVRWGTVAETTFPHSNEYTMNKASSIRTVNNKMRFRSTLSETEPETIPKSVFTLGEVEEFFENTDDKSLVVRSAHHAQGRNLWIANNLGQFLNVVSEYGNKLVNGWYASELIDKQEEFRVYFVRGKVVAVAKKTPADPSVVAWNVAQGGRFDNTRWGEWPMEAIRVSYSAFKRSGLDFGGVDVMTDQEGKAYVIEINSAPSLPYLSDHRLSYRQTAMAKSFYYTSKRYSKVFFNESFESYRDVIHPAMALPMDELMEIVL